MTQAVTHTSKRIIIFDLLSKIRRVKKTCYWNYGIHREVFDVFHFARLAALLQFSLEFINVLIDGIGYLLTSLGRESFSSHCSSLKSPFFLLVLELINTVLLIVFGT